MTAARTIKRRLIAFACNQYKVEEADVEFTRNQVRIGNQVVSFDDLVEEPALLLIDDIIPSDASILLVDEPEDCMTNGQHQKCQTN
mgnify:CR=1 FL=1